MKEETIISYELNNISNYSGFHTIENNYRWTNGNGVIICDNIKSDKNYFIYLDYYIPDNLDILPVIKINDDIKPDVTLKLDGFNIDYGILYKFFLHKETPLRKINIISNTFKPELDLRTLGIIFKKIKIISNIEKEKVIKIDYTLGNIQLYSGFYDIENNYRWTNGNGIIITDNIEPDSNYIIYLDYYTPDNSFNISKTITLNNDLPPVSNFRLDDSPYSVIFEFKFDKTIPISNINIKSNNSTSKKDIRKLGIIFKKIKIITGSSNYMEKEKAKIIENIKKTYSWGSLARFKLINYIKIILDYIKNIEKQNLDIELTLIKNKLSDLIKNKDIITHHYIDFDEIVSNLKYNSIIDYNKLYSEIRTWGYKMNYLEDIIKDIGIHLFNSLTYDEINYEDTLDKNRLKNLYKINKEINALEILLGKTKSFSYPTTLLISLTNKCNFKCKMCLSHSYKTEKSFPCHLSYRVIQNIKELFSYVDRIPFAGEGEPLLYPYLHQLTKFINQTMPQEKSIEITTNGSLIGKHHTLAKHINKINISIDSPYKETLELLRTGAKYEHIINNIKLIKSNYPEKEIGFSIIASRINIDELYELVQLGIELGITYFNIAPVLAFGNMKFLELKKSDYSIFQKQKELMKEIVQKNNVYLSINIEEGCFIAEEDVPRNKEDLIKQLHNVTYPELRSIRNFQEIINELTIINDFEYYPQRIAYFTNNESDNKSRITINHNINYYDILANLTEEFKYNFNSNDFITPYCTAPWNTLFINGDGTVRACCNLSLEESILDKSFFEVWNSPVYVKLREAMLYKSPLPETCKNCNDAIRHTSPQGDIFSSLSIEDICKKFDKESEILKEFRNIEEINSYSKIISRNKLIEKLIGNSIKNKENYYFKGFCRVCNKESRFLLNWKYSDGIIPNYRERLNCESCLLNSRQRFITAYIINLIKSKAYDIKDIYLYEQEGNFYKYLKKNLINLNIIGYEYLGFDKIRGKIYNGIRHEDAMNLSFTDNSFDIIVSNDIYEHVPDIKKALCEAFRILRNKGTMLCTIPFYKDRLKTEKRAEVKQNKVIKLLPEIYHGSPAIKEGLLVFYDFGWDFLDKCKESGFKNVYMVGYYSISSGYLGNGMQFIFVASKE